MTKRFLFFLISMVMVFSLAACSAQAQNTSAQTANTSGQQNPGSNLANQPVESKLAIGTLKLEGTAKAVTAAQAKTLLPLWKAVKSMSASTTASNDEMTAVYKQIEEAMTADQVQAIKALNLSPTDLQALMTKYGVQAPQGGPMAQGTPRANSGSGTNAQAGGPPDDGGAGGPGGAPPDAGGAAGGTTGNGQASAQRTPRAGGAPGGMRGGMNTLLVDPLIKLLTERAG